MALSVTRVSQVLDIRQNYRQFGGVNNKEEFEAVESNLNSFILHVIKMGKKSRRKKGVVIHGTLECTEVPRRSISSKSDNLIKNNWINSMVESLTVTKEDWYSDIPLLNASYNGSTDVVSIDNSIPIVSKFIGNAQIKRVLRQARSNLPDEVLELIIDMVGYQAVDESIYPEKKDKECTGLKTLFVRDED